VVIAADKGLCGSYNSNILRLAHQFIDGKRAELTAAGDRQPLQIITIGKKASDYFTKRGYPVVQNFGSIGPETPYEQVRAASNAITGLYLTAQVDEVYICYTEFITTISQRPQAVKFLPIEPPSAAVEGEAESRTPAGTGKREFIYEPTAPQLLGVLLPRFVETRVYQLLMEAVASEFGARMTAMTNATKNAGEQIDRLTLLANRTRQASITTEILEIVGGAEALKG
jgi:F-type H+-transporting ATPase subunit gamma